MFYDCMRCGHGYHTLSKHEGGCPVCTGMTDAQAQYIRDIYTDLIKLRAAGRRAIYLAVHLMDMIDPQTWRDSGAIGPEGQYEGEYRAAGVMDELKELSHTLGLMV